MNLHPRPFAAAVVVIAAAALPPAEARACGGCFLPATESQSTVVSGHRMAFAISTTHTVLWDQIKYQGNPKEFAWVLPVKGGAVLEISHDAWFETLDAATSAQIVSPSFNCIQPTTSPGCNGGIGCGASAGRSAFAQANPPGLDGNSVPPVTVTHEGTVGPYETVTLHANVPNALPSWLASHGFNINPADTPVIDAYTSEGFDFIALRLQPGQGVQQMKPVRVVTSGGSPTLPLRMVAAGTGPQVPITLFIIGEGRWEAQNFPNGQVDPNSLTWDFASKSSDYATARAALMAQSGGTTWNNAFAHQGSLLSQDIVLGQSTAITVGTQSFSDFASAYMQQGLNDGDTTEPGAAVSECGATLSSLFGSSMQAVSGDCLAGGSGTGGGPDGGAGGGGTGGSSTGTLPCAVPAGDLDAAQLVCGGLDDIAVALVGMHPRDVWLTRLEANLPHAALANDLVLQASAQQADISNVLSLTQSKGDPCAPAGGVVVNGGGRAAARRNQIAMLAAALAAVGAALARRRRRTPVLIPVRIR
jgi:hypothetical protein